MNLFDHEIIRDATISPCGLFRYTLTRRWVHSDEEDVKALAFVMLNPSIADASQDDPTIRRCMGFARDWGMTSLTVLNLNAFIATDPADLLIAADPVGPENDHYLSIASWGYHTVVAAWGVHGAYRGRDRAVMKLLGNDVMCLGTTKDGHPRHPLYVRADQPLVPFELPEAA